MNQILRDGQVVNSESSGLECRVGQFLGGGGQGEVYRAQIGSADVALKWYFPASATSDQRAALETLIKRGAPDDRFLWPMDLVTGRDLRGFGYVMGLRPTRYRGIVDLMKRRIEPSFKSLTTAGIGLSESFLQLHAKGLCYRDISFGNVFFDPENGDILICDNDNVAVDGATRAGVLGTPRFMAPEVVRGDAWPSTQTDLFSLAVLLFYMLMVHHPLEGRKEASIHSFDLPAMTRLYGIEPIFIFDPHDRSNEPIAGYHDNALAFWPVYPQFLRDLFIKAFTDGIRDAESRIRETEWRSAMVLLRDSIVYCSHCGAENFHDMGSSSGIEHQLGMCWSCGASFVLPAHIYIEKKVVMLNRDAQLFPHHIDVRRLYDFSSPVARMVQHPTDPNVWGIKNVSTDRWTCTTTGGVAHEVPPGKSVTLAVGTKIQFGQSEGEIRY
jgi:eukaryotic-like serine/threonine-protein kinase